MWKPWRRRQPLATGGYVGPGIYLLPEVNADPCVLPPSTALTPPRSPEIHLHLKGTVPSEAEFVAMIKRAIGRGEELR